MTLKIKQYIFRLPGDVFETVPAPSLPQAMHQLMVYRHKSPFDIVAVQSVFQPTSSNPEWETIPTKRLRAAKLRFYLTLWFSQKVRGISHLADRLRFWG